MDIHDIRVCTVCVHHIKYGFVEFQCNHWPQHISAILLVIRDLRYVGSPDSRSLYVKVATLVYAPLDRKPMKLLHSLGDAVASPLTCDNASERALQTLRPGNVLNRDLHEDRVGVIEATADERTGNVLGAVQCEVGTDMAECTDVIGTGFWKCRDVCIKRESTEKGNAKNPDLIGNLDNGSGDIDSRGNWKRTWALAGAKHDCLGFVWIQC